MTSWKFREKMSHNGSSETSSFADECWASWFCNLSGNNLYCEVDKTYIEDSFNLFGLKQHIQKDFYSKALDTILDRLGKTRMMQQSHVKLKVGFNIIRSTQRSWEWRTFQICWSVVRINPCKIYNNFSWAWSYGLWKSSFDFFSCFTFHTSHKHFTASKIFATRIRGMSQNTLPIASSVAGASTT